MGHFVWVLLSRAGLLGTAWDRGAIMSEDTGHTSPASTWGAEPQAWHRVTGRTLPACLSAWTSSPGPCGSSAKLQRCSCRAHVTSLREGCDQDPNRLKPWSCGHWGQCCELWCLCHPPSAFPKSHAWQLHALSFTFLEPSRMLLMVRRCGGAPL